MTDEELRNTAKDVLSGHTASHVEAAKAFAKEVEVMIKRRAEYKIMFDTLTDAQALATSYLFELRELRTLAPLLVAIKRARVLHPEGSDWNNLVDEMEELQEVSTRFDKIDLREMASEAAVVLGQRVREEAIDVAVVAWRIANAEAGPR